MKTTLRSRCFGLLPVLVMVFILCFILPAGAQTFDARFPEELLSERLNKISEKSGMTILADRKTIGNTRVSALDATNLTVEQMLNRSLAGTPFTWRETAEKSYAVVRRSVSQEEQRPGRLSGSIIDKDGFPIPGATIMIVGTKMGTASDMNGAFSIELPARMFDVEISCVSFRKLRVSEIKIVAGKTTPLDVVLQESSEELDEVMVTATYKKASAAALYAQQKARVAMTDGVSADMIKKTSDNNVAQVLRRLPGVSLNDGKFITVRGVSERYNNIYVNGASMPSTEPNRKNFAFDLIPTSMVDNIVVAKTFTPDMSAEFAGGTVEVTTLSIPTEPFLSVSLGTGFNTNTTGKPFVSGKRFGSDYLLGNSPTRAWFGRDWVFDWYKDMGGNRKKDHIYNLDAVNRMNANVPHLWGMYNYTGKPMQAYSLTGGVPFRIGEHNFGFVVAASYRHEEKRESYGCDDHYDMDHVQWDNYNITYIQRSNDYTFSTTLGAMANLGWEWRGQKLTWKNMFNNRFAHTSMMRNYVHDNYGQQTQTLTAPRRSQIIQTRLEGEHAIGFQRLKLAWFADYNKLDRESPDERNICGDRSSGENADGEKTYIHWGRWMGTGPGTYDHIFTSDLNEFKKSVGASVEIPFDLLANAQKVKVGWEGSFRNAYYRQYLLQVDDIELGSKRQITAESLEDYAKPEYFLDSTLRYLPWGANPNGDGYAGKMNIKSFYVMGQFSFLQNRVLLSGGIRREKTEFSTREIAKNAWAGTDADSMKFDQTDWFPSVSLTGRITDNLDTRVSYTKTIARYDFREVSNDDYKDIMSGIEQSGNDSLKFTYIDNIDARLEWYPSAGEIVSLSFFYKDFKHPVETYVTCPTGNDYFGTPINLESATGKGLEVNFRKSLGFLAPGTFLKNVYLAGNGMYMKMNVKYKNDDRRDSVRNRPLVDLVPWSVNGSLSWQGDIFGAAVNYGVTGRKLVLAATREAYDEYVAPRHILDLQLSARFMKNRMEIKANASDILNQPEIRYMNRGFKSGGYVSSDQIDVADHTDDMNYNKGKDWMMRRYKKGTSFSFSVSYKF